MNTHHVVEIALLSALTAGCGTTRAEAPTAATTSTPTRSGHVPVNGISYYYEVHGEGEPLLLLHGGLMSIDMFRPILPQLGDGRQVIAIDLHGHGRTGLGGKSIDYIAQGDDLAVVIDQLGYKQVDVLGYSMGGGIAFRLAAQHPDKVRRLVLVSAGFSPDGFYPELLPMQAAVGAGMAEHMKGTPMYETYVKVAPNREEFPLLLDQMGAWMRKPYNWADDAKKLTMPTMLVYGDSDMYRLEHVVEFYKLLGGGQKDAGWQREHIAQNRLAILPDVTHYDMFSAPQLVSTVRPFLDGKSNASAR